MCCPRCYIKRVRVLSLLLPLLRRYSCYQLLLLHKDFILLLLLCTAVHALALALFFSAYFAFGVDAVAVAAAVGAGGV